MEAIKLDRLVYEEALDKINETLGDKQYISLFSVEFPDGINTANTLEICRVIQTPTFDNKVHLMKVCIEGKNVKVTCPNGDVEKFCMSNVNDNFEGFPLFQKDPLALIAIADSLYGYILKKYVRLSMPKEVVANNAE